MENTIKLTSVDDVLNFFTTIPHCSLTVEQLAETAFKVAKNNYGASNFEVIVPYNLINTVCDTLKNYGEEFIDHYDLEDFEPADDNYKKEYSIWIAFNIDIDNKIYNCHFEVFKMWENNRYFDSECSLILLHKDVSSELIDKILEVEQGNKVVTFDLLA